MAWNESFEVLSQKKKEPFLNIENKKPQSLLSDVGLGLGGNWAFSIFHRGLNASIRYPKYNSKPQVSLLQGKRGYQSIMQSSGFLETLG